MYSPDCSENPGAFRDRLKRKAGKTLKINPEQFATNCSGFYILKKKLLASLSYGFV